MKTTRRQFLSTAIGSTAVVSFAARPPQFLLQAAAQELGSREETVLVVVQLSGGNDGLNTIVPYADDDYRKNRPTLAIGQSDILTIDDDCGFHPSMRGFADLLEAGKLSIVQGVGYPNPNRSHFESMDIWHTCNRSKKQRTVGWLGRYLDAAGNSQGGDVPALHLGEKKQPLALAGQDVRVPTVRSLERFRLHGDNQQVRAAVRELASAERASDNNLLTFVQSSISSALAASERVEATGKQYTTQVDYPDTGLAGKLRVIAQLIDAELTTRIYYVDLDGFDTHSQQAGAHTALLGELSGAVSAFISDLSEHGHADRVLLMSFSEFGRRVKENASAGTDHGAAAPMFFAGGRVKPGLIGARPRLNDLADGDLQHHTDFRQVYATVLEDWLHFRSGPILGGEYESLPLIRA